MNFKKFFHTATSTLGATATTISCGPINTVQAKYDKNSFFNCFLASTKEFSDNTYNGYFKDEVNTGKELYLKIMKKPRIPDNKDELLLFVITMKLVKAGDIESYIKLYNCAANNNISFYSNVEDTYNFKKKFETNINEWLKTNKDKELQKLFSDFFKKAQRNYDKINFFNCFLASTREFSDNDYDGHFKDGVNTGKELYLEIMERSRIQVTNKDELLLFVSAMKLIQAGDVENYIHLYKYAKNNNISCYDSIEFVYNFKKKFEANINEWLKTNKDKELQKLFSDFFKKAQCSYDKINFFNCFLASTREFSDNDYDGHFKDGVNTGKELYLEIMERSRIQVTNKDELLLFVSAMKLIQASDVEKYIHLYKYAKDNNIGCYDSIEFVYTFKKEFESGIEKWFEKHKDENLKKLFSDFFKEAHSKYDEADFFYSFLPLSKEFSSDYYRNDKEKKGEKLYFDIMGNNSMPDDYKDKLPLFAYIIYLVKKKNIKDYMSLYDSAKSNNVNCHNVEFVYTFKKNFETCINKWLDKNEDKNLKKIFSDFFDEVKKEDNMFAVNAWNNIKVNVDLND